MKELRHNIVEHYLRHRRDLPWRKTQDPYAIWVSEIMLQQTQVQTVVPRYLEFLKTYPTVGALAAVDEEVVCQSWAGLGYYRRARNLHKGARYVVEHYGGVLPNSVDGLLKIPGIGRYSAGAIASIAFSQPAPIVDGNVKRVFARLFCIGGELDHGPLNRQMWSLAESYARGDSPGDANQALMELGATVCTPKNPTCLICPVRDACAAHRSDRVEAFPVPKTRKAKKKLPITMIYAQDAEGKTWLRQRPLDGLWAGLFELPSFEGRGGRGQWSSTLNVSLKAPIAEVRHILTHRDVVAKVYRAEVRAELAKKLGWKPFGDLDDVGMSALAKKALKALGAAD